MSIAIGEDHVALRDAVRRFAADRCPPNVVRAAVDAEDEALPPFWDELTALGWLGLHLPAAVGGQGYGIAELAVVLEELGRALAPGPCVPTVLSSAAIHAGGGAGKRLPELASGGATGAVALGAPIDGVTMAGDAVVATRHHRAGAGRRPGRPRRRAGAGRRRRALVRRGARSCHGDAARVARSDTAAGRPHLRRRGAHHRGPPARARSRPGDGLRGGLHGRRCRGRGRVVRRHRGGLRHRSPPVRPSHRPVPGREAPLRRHARRRRAGPRRGLGRRAGPRRRRRRRRGRPGHGGRWCHRPGCVRLSGQGLHPGAGRHRLHVGARRPPVPAARHGDAPAARRSVAVARPGGPCRVRRHPAPPAAGAARGGGADACRGQGVR